MYQPIPGKTLWEKKLLYCPETELKKAERMANTPARVATCPISKLGGGPAAGSCLQPLQVSCQRSGMWQGCQAAIPLHHISCVVCGSCCAVWG